jgi:PAS domain S-box-containing protein
MEAVATGKPHENEVRLRRSDGQYRWHLDRGVPLRDKAGNIVKWYGVTTDIEDRKRAEEALHESEKSLRLIVDGIAGLVAIMTAEGQVESVNSQILEYFGKTLEDLKGWSTRDAVHPDDLPNAVAAWMHSAETGDPYAVDHRLRRFDGAYRWFHSRGLSLRDAEGRIVRWYNLLTDIDERKRWEEKLRRSEAYLSEAQKLSHTGSFGWKPDDGEIVWSDETYRIFEYDSTLKPTVDSVVQRVHPYDRAPAQQVIDRASQTGTDFEHEYRLLLADGRVKHVHAIAHAVQNASGNREFIGAVTDITDRKRAEEALALMSLDLQESKTKLEEAQRIAHVGHWVWDQGKDRLTWSDETYRIFGLRPQERPMSVEAFQEMIHPEDREFLFRATQEARGGGSPDIEFRIVRPSGEVRIVHSQGAVTRDVPGQPRQRFGAIQDITDRKHAEEALQQSQFYLAEGQRLAHIGSWAFNPSGFFEYWSRELFKIYGLDPHKGAPTLEQYLATMHPQDRDSMADTIKRMHAERSGCDVTKRIVCPDGGQRYVRCVGIPVVEGEILKGFLGTAMDVTEQELLTQELERRQAYLSEAQKLTHTGSWAWNLRTDERFWSEETFRIFEIDPVKLKPDWSLILDRVHPDDRVTLEQRKKMESTQTEWAESEADFRIVVQDGKIKHLHSIAHPAMDASGQVIQVIGTVMDVTERKRVEDSLRRSESHLAEAQKLTQTGSWAWRLADRKMGMHLSAEWYRICGFDPAEGAPTWEEYLERVHPEDRLKWKGITERAIVEKADYDHEFRILFPNGMVKWIRTVGHPLLSNNGDLEGFVGSSTDITERKHAEEALRSSEAYLVEAQSLTHTGSCAIDGTSRETVYWSDEMFRLFGFDPQQGLPMFDQWLQRIHPEDRDKVKLASERTFLTKVNCDVEFRIVKPDGTVKHIHGIGHPVLSATGELVQVLGTMVDDTERKRSEEARDRLRQLEADLAHIDRVSTLGEMAASLAHEIKQPIAAAITSANSCIEWLAHEPPNLDRARAAAARIDKYGNRAAEIIDRIRSLYKKSPSQRELVDVNGTIHEILTLLKGEADRYSVAMRTDLSAELPKIMLDRVQLQQVFMNLMLNGIEAMEDSGGELTVKSQLQGGQLQFSVSDTGVGLPAEKMDQIFSAFFTTKPQGSGMGLAISRTIVESHGGRLWATANDGRGATFHFTLPIQVAESSPLVA